MRLSLGVAPFFGSTIGSPVTYGSMRRSLVGREIFAIKCPHILSLRGARSATKQPPPLADARAVGDCFAEFTLGLAEGETRGARNDGSSQRRIHMSSAGTSIQRRSAQLLSPSSASCTPLAPSVRSCVH